MHHPILSALGAEHVVDGYDPLIHRVVAEIDGEQVATISPASNGYMEMMYGRSGTIAPAFDPDQMRRRILRVICSGDEAALSRMVVRRIKRPK